MIRLTTMLATTAHKHSPTQPLRLLVLLRLQGFIHQPNGAHAGLKVALAHHTQP